MFKKKETDKKILLESTTKYQRKKVIPAYRIALLTSLYTSHRVIKGTTIRNLRSVPTIGINATKKENEGELVEKRERERRVEKKACILVEG